MKKPVSAVILAAGFSSRAGAFKMELPLDGKALLCRNIESFLPLCQSIVVVGGFEIQRIKRLVEPYSKVKLVENPRYSQGMFSSVQTGALHSSGDFFICPGDYPFIQTESLQILLDGQGEIRIPQHKGKSGHPVFLLENQRESLLQWNSRSSLREFLQSKDPQYISMNHRGILLDMDTAHDYVKYQREQQNPSFMESL
ncbi:MAG: nucleotidyltransferase family protein [Spirochaetaceae bacterium]|nr:nucleotidyltransferase family protein [Spirochaetaceae bacterium]